MHYTVVIRNHSGLQCNSQFLIVNLRTEHFGTVKDTDRMEAATSFKKGCGFCSMVGIGLWTTVYSNIF